jgi:hypothetical protein
MAPSTRKRTRSATKADDGDGLEKGDGASEQASRSIDPLALHRAAAVGDVALVEELLAKGADINAMCDFDIDIHFIWCEDTTPLAVAIAVSTTCRPESRSAHQSGPCPPSSADTPVLPPRATMSTSLSC